MSQTARVSPLVSPTDSETWTIKQRYQRFAEGISDEYMFYAHDPDGIITYVSPSVEKVLNFSVDEVIGSDWREFIHENFAGREIIDRVTEETVAGKHFYKFVVEVRCADNSTRLIEIQQRPVFDEAGDYVSMEGIAKDVTQVLRTADELQRLKQDLEFRVAERTTELIRANEELRRSEERYRTVVDCQTELIVRWLPGAVYTFVNDAFCRLLQKSYDELIGWCFLHVMHPEDVPCFLTAIEALSPNQPVSDFENRLVLPDGKVVWTQWTNQMLFDEDGEFLEYQSVGRDVTALKQAADIIREKETQLTNMSSLATIGELFAGIAHEVHQPLHAAKTFSEAARRNLELGTPENISTALDCTREISEAISRTANIIRQLREFTGLQAESFDYLDLYDVVRGVCNLLAYETRKNHVKLCLAIEGSAPTVQGDRIQLEKLCMNLMLNAYEAMATEPNNDRQMDITSEVDEKFIRILFCDSGCGVQQEDMNKLFDTFYSTKSSGLGMGLPLCQSIAETHGGSIRVRRNSSKGMTFILELPQIQIQHRKHLHSQHNNQDCGS